MAWRQVQRAMAHPVCSDESPGGANPGSHAIHEIGVEGNTVVSPDAEEHPKEAECHKQDSNARGNISLPVQPLKVGTIEPVSCKGLHVSSWHSRCWLPGVVSACLCHAFTRSYPSPRLVCDYSGQSVFSSARILSEE